jgi:hypothetical protein
MRWDNMNGVEILSQDIIYNGILPGWLGVTGFFVTIACFVLLALFMSEGRLLPSIIFMVLILISITFFALALTDNTNSINHLEYKVTIDDSVSMNEFLDKYEILDQEGKIYTVKERE